MRLRALVERYGWATLLLAGGTAVLGYFLLPPELQDRSYQAFGAIGCLAVLTGVAIHRPATGRWWLVMAAGLALLVTGDFTYSELVAAGEPPFPSIADAFYLLGAGSLVVGLAGLAGAEDRGGHRPALLDASLIAVGGSVVAWRLLIDPQLDAGVDPFAGFVAAAYPAIDMILSGVVWRHVLTPGRKPRATLILVLGVSSFLAADLAYTSMSLDGSYRVGLPVDAGWLFGYLCIGAAALHPSMGRLSEARQVEDVITNRRMVLIVGALLLTVVALATTPLEDDNDLVAVTVGAFAVVGLVVVRLFGALVHSRTLLREAGALRAALTIRATTDSLTGLPNRDAFVDAIGEALAATPETVAIAFVDLDNFKQINDTWGHAAGDDVLIEASRRVRSAVAERGTVARLGGDELGVLIRGDDHEAANLAQAILDAFDPPCPVADTSIVLRPSIGIALGRDADVTVMLREADIAMYDAKQAGGSRWSIYRDARLGSVTERYRLSVDLDHAIERNELRLEYQPVVDLRTREVVGVEALVRWDHPTRGTVAPATFVPIAEASGLIGALDRWVLREATRQVAEWAAAGRWTQRMQVHVNIAPRELADPALVAGVRRALRNSGIRPTALVIEVTESALLDGRRTRASLEALARLGVGIALDDFGTRYAVLSSLASLPFCTLKIDRSFVNSLTLAAQARLFEGIIRLADSLGLDTVAEGIETEDERLAVMVAGCQFGQGYLFSRPLRPAQLEAMLPVDGGTILARSA